VNGPSACSGAFQQKKSLRNWALSVFPQLQAGEQRDRIQRFLQHS
jgi:hypothetical protein